MPPVPLGTLRDRHMQAMRVMYAKKNKERKEREFDRRIENLLIELIKEVKGLRKDLIEDLRPITEESIK